jgi:polyhydroxybutyrate depolymerase
VDGFVGGRRLNGERAMRRALLVLAGLGGVVALLAALAAFFLYAPAPPEPRLSARPRPVTIQVNGLGREALVYAPARRAASPPLLVVFHGSMGNPEAIRAETGFGFDRLADRDGFVVAYPRGFEGNWNDCRKAADYPARRLRIDDIGFFEALVDRLQRDVGVDPARIFVVGLSNGGHFVFRLALERPDRIAGAAVFAASLPTADNNDCRAGGPPPPLMIVNGTGDPINPHGGGAVTLFGFGNRGTVLSAIASAGFFAGRGAERPSIERIVPRDPSDRTWVERSVWRTPGRGEVQLLAVHGGGHVVPQRDYRPRRLLGRSTTAIDGPAEAWSFFRRQPDRLMAGPRPQ